MPVYRAKLVFSLTTILLSLQSCGKFGPPLAPEALSPRAVEQLQITSSLEGVKFAWKAPSSDQRGRDLRSLDGYRIYRAAAPAADGGRLPQESDYRLLAELEDRHIEDLLKRKTLALEQNQPQSRVKPDGALMQFEYTDRDVQRQQKYYYRIVPFNQGDVEGQVRQIIRLAFNAENSDVVLIPASGRAEASQED